MNSVTQTTGAWFPIYWDEDGRGYFVGVLKHWKIYGRVK